MPDFTELLPEEEDEQHQRLIRDLHRMYRMDDQKAQHLARIHQRLLAREGDMQLLPGDVIAPRQKGAVNVGSTRALVGAGKRWQHRLSMLAAVLVAALLVSSLLLVLNRAKQSRVGTPTESTGGLQTLHALHMLDASTGWALTEHAVLRTTDGGVHWQNVTPSGITLNRNSIADFPAVSIASIAASQANAATTQILTTADGGQTWHQATIQMPFPRQISFIDAQHGWILAAVRPPGGAAEAVSVLRTTDGGKAWMSMATALFSDTTPAGRLPYGGQKSGLHFLNASTGWVSGSVTLANRAWLYVTHDGGSTWHQQVLLMPSKVPSARLSILSPTFFSDADGVFPVIFSHITTDSDIATAIYATHDGGNTWQSTVPIPAAPRILAFADMQHWWGTDGSILYRTDDGGKHWIKLTPGANFKNVAQLDFVTGTLGWAISSTASASTILLKTVDGGRTWAPITSTVSEGR